ncbi:uncharacterized protein LY89DRAFT_725319 [Mollisia scopiformis]|uniref:Uncharacterized protein n=1 Tax=Mollisia scopiformis TaxID=149040 RepID=A0A132B6E3_MOLSC|nr:uncharacterized protein LY89DRAFT_725319 [Mollisia scopiformis]KUJ07976.1 hypothetical protein LY89DRAFT_725319 [Mollisia scopiformis]
MPSIAQNATRAAGLFQEILVAPHQGEAPKKDIQDLSESKISDILERYQIWAASVGAYVENNNSLEYRLRNAPKVEAQIVELLSDISESLEDACQIITSAKENHTASKLRRTESSDDNLNSISIDPNIDTSVLEQGDSEIREIFESMEDALEHLFRLCNIIRDISKRDNSSQVTDIVASPHEEQLDRDHVMDMFPKLEFHGRLG